MRRIPFLVVLLPLAASFSQAANLVGDANNDSNQTVADAALAQEALYGTASPAQVSPLALAGGDLSLGLDDLLLIAQIANGSAPPTAPAPGLLTLTPPTVAAFGSGTFPLIEFAVASNSAEAQKVDGMELDSGFSILEAVESSLSSPDALVIGDKGRVTLAAMNTAGFDDSVTIKLTMDLLASNGGAGDQYSAQQTMTVSSCAPIECPLTAGEEQRVGTESAWDANFTNAGWTHFDNPAMNGGDAFYHNSVVQPYGGDFTTYDAANTYYVWALAFSSVNDGSFQVRIDGDPIGVWDDSTYSGAIEWRMVGAVELTAGVHAFRVYGTTTEFTYFDGWAVSTNPDFDPQNQLSPLVSYDLNDPALDYFVPGSPQNECCGDCAVDAGEDCDSGLNPIGYGGCDADCRYQYCGDGVVNGPEICDDGIDNGGGEGLCLADCSAIQICGDGIANGSEGCDDGDNDDCTSECDAGCGGPYIPPCGDGILQCGESCDDGPANGGLYFCDDLCSGFCRPEHGWSLRVPGNQRNSAVSIEVNANGNAFLFGDFLGTADFGAGPVDNTRPGNRDLYLNEYDQNGNLLNSKLFSSTGYVWAEAMVLDGAGEIAITGGFDGSIDFGGGDLLCPASYSNVFIAKFDQQLNHLWSRCLGETGDHYAYAISADSMGNLYLPIYSYGALDFGEGYAFPINVNGASYVAVFGPNGRTLNVLSFQATRDDYIDVYDVEVDSNFNIALTGAFWGQPDIGSGPMIHPNTGSPAFVASYTNAGVLRWVELIASTDFELISDLALDRDNNVYLLGSFTETVQAGGNDYVSNGGRDLYLARYDDSGTLIWFHPYGAASHESGYRLHSDYYGRLSATGYFYDTLSMGSLTLAGSGGLDLFVAQFDFLGDPLWGMGFGDAQDNGYRFQIAGDDRGGIYLGGTGKGTYDFGGGPLSAATDSDIFAARFRPPDSAECQACGDNQLSAGEVCDDGETDRCQGSCNGGCTGPSNQCGDGMTACGERCDAGALNGQCGYCSGDCTTALICGDGEIDAGCGETCDDGNRDECDACHNDCTPNVNSCGDGYVCGAEACDDGNNVSGDGCSADCLSNESCGNGVLDVAAGEACDDGDNDNCNACHRDCTVNLYQCGDGKLCGAEVCDDGNALDGDGCAGDCLSDESCGNGVVDQGEACDDGKSAPCAGPCNEACDAIYPFVCGDGNVECGEVCDDGNAVGGDGCSADCLSDESCGNGIADALAGEACDDGDLDDCDECHNDCAINLNHCGDGHVCGSEECDDGNLDDCDGCLDCRFETLGVCGDGVLKSCVEECDEGLVANHQCGGPCEPDCTLAPQPGGLGFLCGDGVVCGAEECDDGNGDNEDGCGFECSVPRCGDGYVDLTLGEECDIGGWYDPCGELNPGWPCDGVQCLIPLGGCGDGYVCPPEDCEPPGAGNCDDACGFVSVPSECKPTPLELALTIDRSGSMGNANRLDLVKAALTDPGGFVDELCSLINEPEPPDSHTLAVVPFSLTVGDQSGNTHDLIRCDLDDGQSVKDFINALTANGSTNYEGALEDAIFKLDNSVSPDHYREAIVFLSDGSPTADNSGTNGDGSAASVGEIVHAFNQAYLAGVNGYELIAIGFELANDASCSTSDADLLAFAAGFTPDDPTGVDQFFLCPVDVLKVMAHLGGGAYFAANGSDISEVYSDIFQRLNDCHVCGNGTLENNEACDDGAICLDRSAPVGDCASCGGLECVQHGGELYCSNGIHCEDDPSLCLVDEDCLPVTGDGCNENCGIGRCGDGIVSTGEGEVCDDGNSALNDACANCRPASCGDGFVFNDPASCPQGGCEQCDDGGLCHLACENDADCAGLCENGLCRCAADIDCGADAECRNGQCLPLQAGAPIGCVKETVPCAAGQTCLPVSNDGCSENCLPEICVGNIPTVIEFLMDMSGSMSSKLDDLKAVAKSFVNHIWDNRSENIQIGLSTFDGNCGFVQTQEAYSNIMNYTQLALTEDPAVKLQIRSCVEARIDGLSTVCGNWLLHALEKTEQKILRGCPQNLNAPTGGPIEPTTLCENDRCGYIDCRTTIDNCSANPTYDVSSCCFQHFPLLQETNKVVVVITDAGLTYDGDPLGLTENQVDEMRAQGIRVFAIGINAIEWQMEEVFNGETCDSEICYQHSEDSSMSELEEMVNNILDDLCFEVNPNP